MKLWAIVFFLLPVVGIGYSFYRTWHLLPLSVPFKIGVLAVLAVCIFLFFANFVVWDINKLPLSLATAAYEVGNSSLFILLYVVMLYVLLDLLRLLHVVPASFMEHNWQGTLTVLAVTTGLFVYGYLHYINKVRQPLELKTQKLKATDRPLRMVMLTDLHIGYHNRADELERWVRLVNAEQPDLVLIGGDIIDGHMRPLREQHMAQVFRHITAPVVACLGNHEYYSGCPEALEFYREAGITLLRDSVATVKGVNIVGRDDRTNPRRKSISELTAGLDRSLYTILLDHQPYHLEEAERAGIDFQLSGHTHYGQVWPISWIEDAIYEDAYGPLQKGGTQYYVTSGIGIWGAKFRIGTRSEYVVAELKGTR